MVLWELDVVALRRALSSGECTPLDVVDACLARIAEVDEHVGAFVDVLAEEARAAAAAGPPDGPLTGVPFGVKDLFDIEGCRTTAGSDVPFGDGAPAATDAPAVRGLRDAGGVLLGRTRTHEFAWGITTRHPRYGGTVNPWDPNRVAGGSSGGSAAAVAAREVPFALGTDTGGSVRIPAAFCGVVGWKPSRGAIPLDGVVPLSRTLDHGGVFARTVADAALVADGAAGREPGAPPVPRAARLGVMTGDGIAHVADALAGTGVELVEVALPPVEEVRDVQVAIQQAEVLALHRDEWGTWPRCADRYGEDVAERFRIAESVVTPERTERAHRRRRELTAEAAALLAAADVQAVLLPIAPCGPSTIDDPDHVVVDGRRVPLRDAVMPWTALGNVSGFPAISVPAGLGDDGLPRAVQLLARPEHEAHLLSAAALVEALFPPVGPPARSRPLRAVGDAGTRR